MEVPDLEAAATQAINEERGDGWPRNGRLYVSDLSVALPEGKCARQLWFTLRDAPKKPLTVGTKLMFLNGDRIHEMFVSWLRENLPDQGWKVVHVEHRCQPDEEGEIGGRLDLEIENEDGERIVIDFKTKRGSAFGHLDDPQESDKLQVQSYIHARRREGANVIGGILLYVDREGSNFVKQLPEEGVILPDPTNVEAAIARTKEVRDMEEPPAPLKPQLIRNQNKGPDSLRLKIPWQAAWCPLKECTCREQLPQKYLNRQGETKVVARIKGTKVKIKSAYKELAPLIARLLKNE